MKRQSRNRRPDSTKEYAQHACWTHADVSNGYQARQKRNGRESWRKSKESRPSHYWCTGIRNSRAANNQTQVACRPAPQMDFFPLPESTSGVLYFRGFCASNQASPPVRPLDAILPLWRAAGLIAASRTWKLSSRFTHQCCPVDGCRQLPVAYHPQAPET